MIKDLAILLNTRVLFLLLSTLAMAEIGMVVIIARRQGMLLVMAT